MGYAILDPKSPMLIIEAPLSKATLKALNHPATQAKQCVKALNFTKPPFVSDASEC